MLSYDRSDPALGAAIDAALVAIDAATFSSPGSLGPALAAVTAAGVAAKAAGRQDIAAVLRGTYRWLRVATYEDWRPRAMARDVVFALAHGLEVPGHFIRQIEGETGARPHEAGSSA